MSEEFHECPADEVRTQYVYLAWDGKLAKIGVSANVYRRLGQLERKHGRKLYLLHAFLVIGPYLSPYTLEAFIRKMFRDKAVLGKRDYFTLSSDDITKIKQLAFDFMCPSEALIGHIKLKALFPEHPVNYWYQDAYHREEDTST